MSNIFGRIKGIVRRSRALAALAVNEETSGTVVKLLPHEVGLGSTRRTQTVKLTSRELAWHLIAYLVKLGWVSPLSVAEVTTAYQRMCAQKNFAVLPWNPVAREFTRMTSGKKVYGSCTVAGTRTRPRIYPPPLPDAVDSIYEALSTPERSGQAITA